MRKISGLVASLCLTACSGQNMPDNSATLPASEVSSEITVPAPRTDIVEERMAVLALSCVHKEYPNKISHVLNDDLDSQPPRALYPAFYGCFDWHSSVHGHWLLTRILKTHDDSPMTDAIIAKLNISFTPENIAREVAYFAAPQRASFERPYGLAWFLQLVAELDESDDPRLQEWRRHLQPLEAIIRDRIIEWLPNLAYPVRSGTHGQSAFGFALMLDYARTVGDRQLEDLLVERSRSFYGNDIDCPLSYEPSGADFLSPCLQEADLMRRIMTEQEFSNWLTAFLPDIPHTGDSDWLAPGIVIDPNDGHLVHLDGVNLSRSWAMDGIAAALPADDPRQLSLQASARLHRETGVAAISSDNYEGSHWLGSFATYLTTRRGTTGAGAPR